MTAALVALLGVLGAVVTAYLSGRRTGRNDAAPIDKKERVRRAEIEADMREAGRDVPSLGAALDRLRKRSRGGTGADPK